MLICLCQAGSDMIRITLLIGKWCHSIGRHCWQGRRAALLKGAHPLQMYSPHSCGAQGTRDQRRSRFVCVEQFITQVLQIQRILPGR